jgi:inorganic pyrophosphatase/exopolyphosphatase
MKIVTSGIKFLDIDAYAGCVAYAELLNLQGIKAIGFSSAELNESVTQTIRSWNAPFSASYTPSDKDSFIIIDVSQPDFIDNNVDLERVEEIIDHHTGYEKFWKEKIGSKANIEFIGAASTLVYESWQKAKLFDRISETSARLLISGILDNTLNFEAEVTTDRDHRAYQELSKVANLPQDWAAQYFKECEESIFADIENALVNDTKIMKFQTLNSDNVAFGQLVVWDAKRAIVEYREIIEKTMASKSEDWFINAVSIGDGQSFLLASNNKVIDWAERILNVKFDNRLARAERLWLRKEIVKQDLMFLK